jgi:hypothetical protein
MVVGVPRVTVAGSGLEFNPRFPFDRGSAWVKCASGLVLIVVRAACPYCGRKEDSLSARRLLTTGLLVVVLSACAHAGPAQVVLEDPADSTHNERIATGAATMAVGVPIGCLEAACS